MKLHVRFRFNKLTGQVEEMLISDQDQTQVEPDHDRRHDEKSAEVARVVSRHPSIREVPPGAEPMVEPPESGPEPVPQTPVPERRRGRQGE